MQIRVVGTLLAMASALLACSSSDDDKPAAQPATVNKQVAAATAQSTIVSLSATLGSDPSGSATSLSSVAQSSQNLLQASPGTSQARSALSVVDDLATLDLSGAGCSCTATSCTFTNCSPGGASTESSFTIDGSYAWGGGHVECKSLKYTFKGSNSSGSVGISSDVTVTLDCDLTVTATSLEGFLHSAGSSSANIAGQNTQASYSANWDVKSTYTGVTYDSSHKPTAGTLHVSGTTSVTAAGASQTFAGSADVAFPAQ